MKCKNCGRKLTGKENFCRICGTPVEQENDKSELTDNIDVSKIEIAAKENIPEDDTMELKANTKKSSSELSAMLELTAVEKEVVDEKKEEIIDSKEEKVDEEKNLDTSDDLVQKTEELLLSETDSSTKIKEILKEMKPENEDDKKIEIEEKDDKEEKVEEKKEEPKEENEIIVDENQEPTAVIPENLISKFEKVKDTIEEKKEEKVDDKEIEEKQDIEKKEEKVDDKEIEEKQDVEKEQENKDSDVEILSEKVDEVNKTDDKEETLVQDEKVIDQTTEELVQEEPIISIENDKTVPLEISTDKTAVYDKPIIPEDDYTDSISKRDSKGIIFMILFIISLGVIGYLLFMNYSSSNKLDKAEKDNDKLSNELNELSNENKKDDKKENIVTSAIKYNGYSFDLTGYTYNFYNSNLVINTEKNVIGVEVKQDLKYSDIKDNKEDYRKLFDSVKSYGTKVIEDREYVVFEFSKAADTYLAAYTNISDNDTVAYIINFKDKEIDYDVLLTTNKITSSAKVDSLSEMYDIKLFEK